jgi:hypothetical protein
MADIDVTKLLDPHGPQLQKAARGMPNEARAAVMVHWGQIERAMDSGYAITAIYRVLTDAGLLSISLRSFHRQVQARREGARGSRAAAKPATEPRPSAGSAEASEAAKPVTDPRPAAGNAEASEARKPGAPAPVAAARPTPPEIKPGIPHRPWRTGPHIPPDPNAVFRPRDPLADD